jgi:hypothetical protein
LENKVKLNFSSYPLLNFCVLFSSNQTDLNGAFDLAEEDEMGIKTWKPLNELGLNSCPNLLIDFRVFLHFLFHFVKPYAG